MKLPRKRSERIAALILIGILFGLIVVAGLAVYLANQKPTAIPIEQALWVTDWEIERIYGPGTPEQQMIVAQFGSDLEFEAPVLYRMGRPSASNPSEGLLLYGFDPDHPEMAKLLAAAQEAPK
jgi:hypothetical protein